MFEEEGQCLSIRQPFNWIIAHPEAFVAPLTPKIIECREQYTRYRGPIFLHAGKKPLKECYNRKSGLFVYDQLTVNGVLLEEMLPRSRPQAPMTIETHTREQLNQRDHAGMGGICAIAWLTDVVRVSSSPWFIEDSPYGYVLEDAQPLPFYPLPGKQGLFPVDIAKIREYYDGLIVTGQWTWPWAWSTYFVYEEEEKREDPCLSRLVTLY